MTGQERKFRLSEATVASTNGDVGLSVSSVRSVSRTGP